ncbi:MAG: helicase C-terminal domain-containing protein [Candidatus Gracilibacteria bacterium]|nr:helicase C-terminal domain-containing protein [Candidatus Gracilibacteria bacterium]MDD4530201.1 helicase C-terminal domain-containing protein [Candidatus Gracilibacteria bacterium]
MYLVSIDLETTGLDPKFDGIIEIGMVKYDFEKKKIFEKFTSLINPGMIISEEINIITGITNKDLESAPFFSEIKDKIESFVGEDDIIIGHNVDFDLGFLREYKVDYLKTQVLDTFKLAQILFFKEKSLNLGFLCDRLGINFPNAHRALADAEGTLELFIKIIEIIKDLPKENKDILRFISGLGGKNFFMYNLLDILGIIGKDVYFEGIEKLVIDKHDNFEENFLYYDEKIDIAFLEKQEQLRKKNKFLEKRDEQEKMMKIVNQALHKSELMLIEAPTGIGKTYGYLVPSIIYSVKTGEQIFVSTNTKTLQDQIIFKDIPQIQDIFHSLDPNFKFSFTKVKGRRNYISLLLFFEFLRKDFFEEFELILIGKILFWLLETETGELDELNFYGKEFSILRNINAFDKRVLYGENDYLKQEPLYKARNSAKKSNVVIINHSLLIGEFNEEGRNILPKIKHLIIDEGHNLGNVATDSLKRTVRMDWIVNLFKSLENILMSETKQGAKDKKISKKKEEKENFIDFMIDREAMDSIMLGFGLIFDFAFKDYLVPKNNENQREILITNDLSKFNATKYKDILNVMETLEERIDNFVHYYTDIDDKIFAKIDRYLEELQDYFDILHIVFFYEKCEFIKIATALPDEGISLSVTKLDIGNFLKEQIWNELDTAILTSATFEINGDFSYFEKFFKLDGFKFFKLKSDFDYPKQMSVLIPSDLGDHRNTEERNFINSFLLDILKITLGKTLCLMTSFSSIREIFTKASLELQKEGVQILAQNVSGGKHKLIENFKMNSANSIILGTDSFWEGVDFPGEDLEYLVIYKLPFNVPTDPVFMARSSLFEDSFREFGIPNMLVKLKQGIGRLIRTKHDKGIVILLDKRVNSAWGRDYIKGAFPKGVVIRTIASGEILDEVRRFKNETGLKF